MTKAKACKLILTFTAFLVSLVSCSTLDSFLQCLETYSKTPNPIQNFIYTPSNSSYSSVLHFYARNSRIITSINPKPLSIVAAAEECHVQAAVTCANSLGLQIRIRSGGHDYEGLSYTSDVPFVILDMFNLRSIDINIPDETAWIQTGVTLGELYYAIAQKSKVHGFPGGVCPTVGVGGHFSGGGYGNLMRKYGLSVDNIVDAKLIDVNGKILDRESMGEDVFWAIRGGGGASFGVILSWKIKLVSVPENVIVFRVNNTISEGAMYTAHRWQYIASELPKDLFIRVQADSNQKDHTGMRVFFIGMFLGEQATLLPLMNRSFPELGLKETDCISMSWLRSTMFWWGFPLGTPTEALLNRTFPTTYFKYKSDFVREPISEKALQSIYKRLVHSNKLVMQWSPYGGRMGEISESATPFPHRKGVLFKIQYLITWEEDEDEKSKRYIEMIRELYKAMTPYVSKLPREAFLNYRDLDIGKSPDNQTSLEDAAVYGVKFFKGNFERLMRAKTIVDPANFFKNEQSIPPLSSSQVKNITKGRRVLSL